MKKLSRLWYTNNNEEQTVEEILGRHAKIEERYFAMQNENFKRLKLLLSVMFAAAFICAFVAAGQQIVVAKQAARDGHPQSRHVVLFLLLTKILKAPKTYLETYSNRMDFDKLYFNGILSLGVTVAIIIWAIAYHYTLMD